VAGEVAVIAYSVTRVIPGPNGESSQAFVVRSADAGATWSCLPLVRTMLSSVRFWGFPVWPPEHIDTLAIESGLVRIGFRDAWVPHEPGGESLWTGVRSARGLWTVRRIRRMDYSGTDAGEPPPPIGVDLPGTFRPPPAELLVPLATRLASDERANVDGRLGWVFVLAIGSAAALLGMGWRLLGVAAALATSFVVLCILGERRRYRRTVSLSGGSGGGAEREAP
jgi:hypothetical protein